MSHRWIRKGTRKRHTERMHSLHRIRTAFPYVNSGSLDTFATETYRRCHLSPFSLLIHSVRQQLSRVQAIAINVEGVREDHLASNHHHHLVVFCYKYMPCFFKTLALISINARLQKGGKKRATYIGKNNKLNRRRQTTLSV